MSQPVWGGSPEQWEADIAGFEASDTRERPAPGGIVFVGSSSIRRWDTGRAFADLLTINRGFGGSMLADSVYYAHRIILPYKPRVVVIYAGDNDIAFGRTPDQTRDEFVALTSRVCPYLPDARILFLSLKPSPSRWRLAGMMAQTNGLIADVIRHYPKLYFLDVHHPMLGPDGLPRPELYDPDDELHLSADGYRLWNGLVRPKLIELTREPSASTLKR